MNAEVENAPPSSSAAAYKKPRTRQRIHKSPPTLAVPNINDDASERKRVLNVLAQRRYRQRKKQARRGGVITATDDGAADSQDQEQGEPRQKCTLQTTNQKTPACPASDEADKGSGGFELDPQLPADETLFSGTDSLDLDLQGWAAAGGVIDTTLPDIMGGGAAAPEQAQQLGFFEGDDAFMISQNASSSSAFSPNLSMLSYFGTNAFIPGSTTTTTTSSSSSPGDDDEFSFSFPDSYLLPMAELTLLRAFGRIAKRLGCTGSIFELEAGSPFVNTAATTNASAVERLPANLRPTASQATVPHHPVLDLLPWPRVRDRIIGVLSVPEAARPPAAADPLALVRFSYDMEDGAEGMRVWGPDIYDPAAWEVGQVFFEHWWFIFDRQVIERSNYWRRLRGAPELRLKGS